MLTFKYPYTNFSEVNLDYVLSKMRETVEAVNAQETTLNGCVNNIKADKNIIRVTKVDGTSTAITVTASDSFCVTLDDNSYSEGAVQELDLGDYFYCKADTEISNVWAALRAGLSVRLRYKLGTNSTRWSVPLTLDYGGSRAYFGLNEGTLPVDPEVATSFKRKYFMLEYDSDKDCIKIRRLA